MSCKLGSMAGILKWTIDNETIQLKFSETEKGFNIETIIIPATCRGKGIGSKLLQQFIEFANLHNKDIYVTARPLGGRTNPERLERLVRFYQKSGFEEVEKGITVSHMVRYTSQKILPS